MAAAEEPRLKDWFPLNPKECRTQGNAFFDCFSKHTLPNEENADPSAALERCAKEMEQYDKCMEKWSKSHSLTYYRVQEEYRKKGVQ